MAISKTFQSNYWAEGKIVRKYSGRGSVWVGDGTTLLRELRKLERAIHTLRLEKDNG